MRVLGPAIDLELLGHVAAKLVLGQHAPDGNFDHPLWKTLHQRLVRFALLATRVVNVRDALFLLCLAAGEDDFLGVGDDHEIAGINLWRILRTVLAHEDRGDLGRNAAEHLALGIHMVPLGLDVTFLGKVRLTGHGPTWLLEEADWKRPPRSCGANSRE